MGEFAKYGFCWVFLRLVMFITDLLGHKDYGLINAKVFFCLMYTKQNAEFQKGGLKSNNLESVWNMNRMVSWNIIQWIFIGTGKLKQNMLLG